MSLYITLKLIETVFDISVMRILKNCQWKFCIQTIDFYHTYITHL